jgi:tetratricopeptide (TPR) repeat protein
VEIDTQAKVEFAAGNQEEAFKLWYRELRLQRALSRKEEITALARVGAIAWENNLSQHLRFITQRLVTIEEEATAKESLTPQLLDSLATAYEQVRDVDKAIAIYQKILTNTRKQDDIETEKLTLETLGKLYLAKFDYVQAAKIYEELLSLVPTEVETAYLHQLAEIYDRLSQPAKALGIKEQLAQKYLNNQQLEELAVLKISLAENYQATQQLEKASQNYQEAYALAKSLQQLALTGDSLEKLAKLYSDRHQSDRALQTYQELLKVQQKSYNFYGLMNTYDRIANVYWQQNNYTQALTAFEQGLTIAESLNYRVDYFTGQINKINQQMGN